MSRSEKISWVLTLVFVAAAFALLILWVRAADNNRVDTTRVDESISEGMREADKELMEIITHLPQVKEKVVIVREEISSRILGTRGDELAAAALARAERFRSRLIASGDIQHSRGIHTE